MPRFAANLSMMYQEHEFIDRFGAAAKDGFKGIEFLFPYAHPAADIRARLTEHGLSQALFNGPPGNWDAGERGLASLPGRESEFKHSVERALEYARVLGNERVHLMAGLIRPGEERARHRANQYARYPGLLPQPPGRGAQHLRRSRRAEPQGADGFLSLPDRRGRSRDEAAALHRRHRPYPDRGRTRAPRARSGRDQLSLPVRADGRARLRRLGRLRVPAQSRDQRRARLGEGLAVKAPG